MINWIKLKETGNFNETNKSNLFLFKETNVIIQGKLVNFCNGGWGISFNNFHVSNNQFTHYAEINYPEE